MRRGKGKGKRGWEVKIGEREGEMLKAEEENCRERA